MQPSACDSVMEYALPKMQADMYSSLFVSNTQRVQRYARGIAGPDEVTVELEGPELLSLEPSFNAATCR